MLILPGIELELLCVTGEHFTTELPMVLKIPGYISERDGYVILVTFSYSKRAQKIRSSQIFNKFRNL